jgi:peptide subunit release factor 1 (eRF1)
MHMPQLLSDRLHELAAIDAGVFPILSLYLNTEPGDTGRPRFDVFLRRDLRERAATYAERSPERDSVDTDVQRIEQYVERGLQPSTRGLAVFASSGAKLFEAIPLEVAFSRHELVIGSRPYLYPLARLDDENPRYAAVVVDTNLARIVVFSTGRAVNSDEVRSEKIRHTKAGGWSQARFQRHVDHKHLQHAKEVVDRLDEIVRAEGVDHIVLAGDEVIIPIITDQLSEPLARKVVDVLRLDIRSPEHEVFAATLEAVRHKDEETDESVVRSLIDDYRAGGLAVLGLEGVQKALTISQVHVLVISAAPERIKGSEKTANELVVLANQTGAQVRFIENRELLAAYGGVGASLRFRP